MVANVAGACTIGGTTTRLASNSGISNISDIIQSFDHDKSSSS